MPSKAKAPERIEVGRDPRGLVAAGKAGRSKDQLCEALAALELQTRRAEYAEAALMVAQGQRDALRTAFRRRVASSNLLARVAALETEVTGWRNRVTALEAEAAEWRSRYFNLRSRLEAILQRFGILRLARLTPPPLRRFVRNRMLGPKRQS